MTDYFLPNYARITGAVSEVADNLDRTRDAGVLRRNLPSGQIERGDALMNGSRILYQHCGPLMNEADQVNFRTAYNKAADAREKLDASDVSGFQRFRDARTYNRLSKKTYRVGKRASDRALDNSVLGRNGGTDPAAGPSPATPEESGGTDPPAGPPPATPGEPPRPPPHNSFTESHGAATSSRGECIQDTQTTTLPSGDADTERPMDETRGTSNFIYEPSKATSEITIASYQTARDWIPDATMTTMSTGDAGIGRPIDEVPETLEYDESWATSGTSITSYKTEKTVNSRKSRYNVLPRHKYADHGYLRPQGHGSLGVGDALDPKIDLGDGCDQSPSNPVSGTQPVDGPSTAPPNTEHVHGDTWSQPPTPRQGVEFLTANPTGLMGGEAASVSTVSDVDVFGSDSEAGAD